jgi:hypothetical protein
MISDRLLFHHSRGGCCAWHDIRAVWPDFYAANSNAFPIIIAPLTVGHNHGSEARNELDQYTLRPPWKQLGRILKADRLNCLGWMAVHLQRLQ